MSDDKLREAFDICDPLQRGYITPREFSKFVYAASDGEYQPTKDEAHIVMMYYCNTYQLSFSKFSYWWNQLDRYKMFRDPYRKRIRKAYKIYMRYLDHGTHALDFDHLHDLVMDYGMVLTYADFSILDENGDNMVSFKEFCHWLKWFE